MLFFRERPLVSNAVNGERDRFGTFRGRSRTAVVDAAFGRIQIELVHHGNSIYILSEKW
ncbi:MAG: hypothetical protein IJY19_12265 [Ruminococcus sp.]|nr:hypothetical protein [Ruminococcus sp.]